MNLFFRCSKTEANTRTPFQFFFFFLLTFFYFTFFILFFYCVLFFIDVSLFFCLTFQFSSKIATTG